MIEERRAADEIARLEDEIERHAALAEGCRKIMLAARLAIAAGAALLLTALLGLWAADALVLLAALTVILGGIVVSGSNASTRRESLAAAAVAEARRAALIDAMSLHLVPEPGEGADRLEDGRGDGPGRH